MLDNDNKKKIENYVDKIINTIKLEIDENIKLGLPNKEIIEKLINCTVRKFTPESKMILSSTYNMLMEKTLLSKIYNDVNNKAAFYELDILKRINSKFNFEVPNYIDYKESDIEINKLVKSGSVVIVGGIVSITLNTIIPVGIAIVIAGIMGVILNDQSKSIGKNINIIVEEYLENVRNSILSWIKSIENYYDDCVLKLERELIN